MRVSVSASFYKQYIQFGIFRKHCQNPEDSAKEYVLFRVFSSRVSALVLHSGHVTQLPPYNMNNAVYSHLERYSYLKLLREKYAMRTSLEAFYNKTQEKNAHYAAYIHEHLLICRFMLQLSLS